MKFVVGRKINLFNLKQFRKPMLETSEPKQAGRPVELHRNTGLE
jgi:hypothetical protein